MKIGILLGSFDPIHMGHLHMAVSALNADLVDKVVFVPTKQNPWKNNSTNFYQRCNMVQLALLDLENCEVSSIEDNIKRPYYSYKTLELLKEKYFKDELHLIVGVDTAKSIKNWQNGNWILTNFKLIVITRPGYENTGIVDIPKSLDISSTEIRKLVKNKKQIYPLVPKIVNDYIKSNNLYK